MRGREGEGEGSGERDVNWKPFTRLCQPYRKSPNLSSCDVCTQAFGSAKGVLFSVQLS